MVSSLFQSFFLGGFECSTQRLRTGKRLDLLSSTQHDQFVLADYRRLQKEGIYTARSGIRWHLIERTPYYYDFSSVLPQIRAAQSCGMQIIWDLFHYGWPDDLDIFQPVFVERFTRMVAAFVHFLKNESDQLPLLTPINEISYVAWAAGDDGAMNPFAIGRGTELKAQLVRAAISACEAIWQIEPKARIFHIEPMINIVPNPDYPEETAEVEGYNRAQWDAWDMIAGRFEPQLGGNEKYIDVIGVNYYPHNQWMHRHECIYPEHTCYKPFRQVLQEVYQRYQRPFVVAETGAEGEERAGWFRYLCGEVYAAIEAGVPVQAICLYPILNFPGWNDDRDCQNGLWGYADEQGERAIYPPLADELRRQQQLFKQLNFTAG